MANTFKSSLSKSIGTSATNVYTVPGSTTTILIGCTVANTTISPITCDVMLNRNGQDFYLVKTAVIPVGSAFVWTGGDQKTVAQSGDIVRVVSSTASAADVILSYLEIA